MLMQLNTASIKYELYGGLPDFSTYTWGSEHTVVLRNKKTMVLEQISFRINGKVT